jgi:hypothetical protein
MSVNGTTTCVIDFTDNAQVDPLTLVRERLITLYVLEQGHLTRPDRGREHRLELALDSHLMRKVDHVLDAFHLGDLNRGNVARLQ